MQMVEVIKPGYVRISDVAQAYAGYGSVPKGVLAYAADRGTKCHELIFDLMNDIIVTEDRYYFQGKNLKKIKENESPSFIDSWEKYYPKMEIEKIELQEERLYDEDLMTTGKPDLVAIINGERVLIDWKATSKVGNHWMLQAAGYHELLKANGWTICKMMFVKLDKDGEAPMVKTYHPNQELFLKALELYNIFFKDLKINLEMD